MNTDNAIGVAIDDKLDHDPLRVIEQHRLHGPELGLVDIDIVERLTGFGFCHADGAGPFYKALLHLPNIVLTYPHLKIADDRVLLFYPKGGVQDDDDGDTSSVYEIPGAGLKYGRMNDDRDEFIFRMSDKFEDWRIDGGLTRGV